MRINYDITWWVFYCSYFSVVKTNLLIIRNETNLTFSWNLQYCDFYFPAGFIYLCWKDLIIKYSKVFRWNSCLKKLDYSSEIMFERNTSIYLFSNTNYDFTGFFSSKILFALSYWWICWFYCKFCYYLIKNWPF